jgi:thimet oligopeptidase
LRRIPLAAGLALVLGHAPPPSELTARTAPLIAYPDVSAAIVAEECAAAIEEADAIVDGIVAVEDGNRTFENTLYPLHRLQDLLGQAFGKYAFLGYVSPDPDLREAARTQEEGLDKYTVDLGFREDVFDAVLAYSRTAEAAESTGERRRFLDFTLRDYRRNGFGRGPEVREEVQEMKRRLVELGLEYEQNLADWKDGIEVPPDRAGGLPEEYLAGLERRENGSYWVSLDYPDLFPFMANAEDGELRRALLEKSWNKGFPRNVELLEEAISLRDRIAKRLEYPSWNHYVIEVRMAGDPQRVFDFLEDLSRRVRPKLESDLAAMREPAEESDPDGQIDYWDWRFWNSQQMRTQFAVDPAEISKYFPLDRVLTGMFAITQEMFGLRYEEVSDPETWQEDVQLFEVRDTGTDERIGFFYTDLFPRDGKFGHAAAFPLRSGGTFDGRRQLPVSAIVANLTKPTEETPSLLTHEEVETLFHEFGHILHQVLTRAELTRFTGTETEHDFVEAPSQNLEHWIWAPEVLDRFAAHFETGEKMPREMIEGLVAAKQLNSGIRYLRQVYYATLDLRYHEAGERKNTTKIMEELHPICGFPALAGTHMQAGFGHLFGYDSSYYSYLWSKVFGDDMFTAFEEAGILNPEVGMRWRREIYEKGGTLDGDQLVRNFLGREPNNEAFLRDLGLEGE